MKSDGLDAPPALEIRSTAGAMRSVAAYGFAAFVDAITPAFLDALHAEADERFRDAVVSQQSGAVSYRANIAELGPLSHALLEDPLLAAVLTQAFGQAFALSETRSCFTRYRAGDHLGPHLDQPPDECAVTVIAYLRAESPDHEAEGTGLVLKVYGETPESVGRTRLRIPTRAGTLVVGRGARVWHERPKLAEGETVVAITSCYRVAA